MSGLPMSHRVKSGKKRPRLLYKMDKGRVGLVPTVMRANGIGRTSKADFCVYWASHDLRSHEFKEMKGWQRVNQFPRTREITMKDALARNVVKMQQLYGKGRFDFLPMSFVLPGEADAFRAVASKMPGGTWICKPSNSSCGRGIFVTSKIDEILRPANADGAQSVVVSQYVDRPLLVDELKFDMRIYVAVTSFCPLTVYVFDDGLARFATEKYTNDPRSHASRFQHLTNYSVNKHSTNFVENDDVKSDTGTKQSLQVLMRRLRDMGLDVSRMWARIHDLIIKTFLSIEAEVMGAVRSKVPKPQCCFQLFGFDVLIDQDLRPWLIEVNFAPSLNTDADIDLAIKGEMVADLLNLAGVKARPVDSKKTGTRVHASVSSETTDRPHVPNMEFPGAASLMPVQKIALRRFLERDTRRGRFYRIFPNRRSFSYRPYFTKKRTHNRSDALESKDMNEVLSTYLYHQHDLRSGDEDEEAARSSTSNVSGRTRVQQQRYLSMQKATGELDGGCIDLAFNEIWGRRAVEHENGEGDSPPIGD